MCRSTIACIYRVLVVESFIVVWLAASTSDAFALSLLASGVTLSRPLHLQQAIYYRIAVVGGLVRVIALLLLDSDGHRIAEG